MVNNDRIVPIMKIDFLSMIGTVLAIANVSTTVLAASDVEGTFAVTGSGSVGNLLVNQPVKTLNFASGVTAATVYFVAGFDFEGFTVNGAAATIDAGGVAVSNVKKDGISLYKAVLGSGTVTITAVTPILA